MDSRNIVFKETAIILVGELIFLPLMLLIFFLAGHFDPTVVYGGLAGAVLAVVNFFAMAMSTSVAADKAAQQDVKGGQATMQTSFILRQLLLFGALILCAKSGVMNLLALVLPVLFVRPIITIAEFFRKKGGK
ncbi:MAG: ATP synthase subunit I [Oscillospiraceae bacterium]|nr:ATP synthase subunit I [Oscillospiraceae bacterium]